MGSHVISTESFLYLHIELQLHIPLSIIRAREGEFSLNRDSKVIVKIEGAMNCKF